MFKRFRGNKIPAVEMVEEKVEDDVASSSSGNAKWHGISRTRKRTIL